MCNCCVVCAACNLACVVSPPHTLPPPGRCCSDAACTHASVEGCRAPSKQLHHRCARACVPVSSRLLHGVKTGPCAHTAVEVRSSCVLLASTAITAAAVLAVLQIHACVPSLARLCVPRTAPHRTHALPLLQCIMTAIHVPCAPTHLCLWSRTRQMSEPQVYATPARGASRCSPGARPPISTQTAGKN